MKHNLAILTETGQIIVPLRSAEDVMIVKLQLDAILQDNDKGLPPWSNGRNITRFTFTAQYGETVNTEVFHASVPAWEIKAYFISPSFPRANDENIFKFEDMNLVN